MPQRAKGAPENPIVTEAISHYLLDVTVCGPAVLRELREETLKHRHC